MIAVILLVIVLLVCLILNVPIAIALGISGLVVVLVEGTAPLSMFIQTSFEASNSFPLLAVPFFVLAGYLMSAGGMAARLVNFFQALLYSFKGSSGIITIFACLLFSAISGSGAATVASIGAIMIPYMIKNGYDARYAAPLTSGAGALGSIVPPSIIFIIYGISASVSIGDMFIAGIIPGLLMAFSLLVVNAIISKKENYEQEKKSDKKVETNFWKSLNEAKYAILAPVIILGGIYGGIVTPTEAAVIAVVYTSIVSVLIYKDLKISDLPKVFIDTSITSGTVLIFIGIAAYFGNVMVLEQIPQMLVDSVLSVTTNKIIILILINIFLLVVGMFMETVAAILIFTPLLLPIASTLGVDPVHFGIIMCLNLSIGLLTPPLGINLYIASGIAKVRFESTMKFLIYILTALLIVLALVTYIPDISLFLVNLLKQ